MVSGATPVCPERRNVMGVAVKYSVRGKTYWKVDEWLKLPDGRVVRFRMRKIPTREQAEMLIAKRKAEAFEGRFFDRARTPTLTVAEAWEAFEPIAKRDKDSWQTDVGRARHLVRHLGSRRATKLSLRDVDEYRTLRLGEKTRRKTVPMPATLDREIALLHRMLSYAVECGTLPKNPIAGVKLLRKPNVRRVVIDEPSFARLLDAAEEPLKPIVLVAYDQGLRKGEILSLTWSQVNLKVGVIRLAPQDTKGGEHRPVYLTGRTLEALKALPRYLHCEHVFVNSETGERWKEIRAKFRRAREAAGLKEVWFHDLRRSFVTNARRRGVPESVVMKLSGHRTRSVFDRYNVVSEDDLQTAVKQIEAGAAIEGRGSGQEMDKVRVDASGDAKAPPANPR
jgi:integrase